MDRNSNADDVFGRLLFTGAYGQQFAAPTGSMLSGMDTDYEDGSQEGTARIQETHSNSRYDAVCGGCGSHSSLPHRMVRAITNHPLVHENVGQRDSHISSPASDGDEITDRQQPGYRPLEQRDPEGPARHSGGAQGSRPNPDTFWLPFWARKTTSILFMVTFALMAAILEVLFTVSERNPGLSPGVPSVRYCWSYGTTGILTLTAALWHRLDYETKLSAPWLRKDPVTANKAALLVDYVNAWSLLAPFRALRNNDYEVVYSSTISLLLQVLIVLSTALFTLAPTNSINEAEPVVLTSKFVDDPARLKNTKSLLPYYITMGTELNLYTGNLSDKMVENPQHPEGCTNHFAYQTFNPASSTLEKVTATVDGLALGLACETASVGESLSIPNPLFGMTSDGRFALQKGDSWPHFNVEYQGCQANIKWMFFGAYPENDVWRRLNHNGTSREHWMALRIVPGLARGQCNSTARAANRLVFLSAEVEFRSNQYTAYDVYDGRGGETVWVSVDAAVSKAVALVCAPSLEQTLLDVSRSSGGVQSISRHGGSPANVFRDIQPWDFIDFFFDPYLISDDASFQVVGNTTVWADYKSQAVLAFCGQACLGGSGFLNNAAFLETILARFLTDYAATTAHTILTERVNITSTGISSNVAMRLWVQPFVCQAMVALLAVITLTIVGFQFKHRKQLRCRVNPGSIAATAILAGQVASSRFPKDLGSASAEDLPDTLGGFLVNHASFSSYHLQHSPTTEESSLTRTITDTRPSSFGRVVFQNPLPLRPVSHIALVWTLAACGTTLMVLLRKSADDRGLGDAADSKYLLLAWTIVPATILTVISWWLSSIDTQVRLLAPYHLLKSTKCSCSVLRMDLLRGLVPFVLYQELKASNIAAASTTLAALLAAILTTVSAAVFQVIIFPVSRPVEFSPKTVFTKSTPEVYNETSRLASLILETNLSYPRGSYQDLVFPEFSMTPLGVGNAPDTTNASSATIKVTAPALRPRLSCLKYSPADLSAAYVRNQTHSWSGFQWNGVVVNISSEICQAQGSDAIHTAMFETGNLSEFIFATATSYGHAIDANGSQTCNDMLYIWGYHKTSLGPVTNISAAGCNNSVELVDVTFSFFESDLRLDLSDPPAVIETTVRDDRGHRFLNSFSEYDLYYDLASLPVTSRGVFDPFFQQLVTSRYAIPVSAIGDPTRADIVMDAIRLQHGIIEAQYLNSNFRIDMNSSTAMENVSAVLIPTLFNQSTSDGTARYPATVTYPFGRHRVVQDPTATAILEALLLSILVLVMLGWYLSPRDPALPRSPSSIGSVLAFLAGGNVLERLYDGGPEPQCWDDVKSRLGKDSKLYLGWNTVDGGEGGEQRRFGIWVTD